MTTEPFLFTEAQLKSFLNLSHVDQEEILRERGLIADEPVDAMRDAIADALDGMRFDYYPDPAAELTERLRKAGMELAQPKELTREMVEAMTFPSCDAAYREVYGDPVPKVDTPYTKAFARHFHTALTEALK